MVSSGGAFGAWSDNSVAEVGYAARVATVYAEEGGRGGSEASAQWFKSQYPDSTITWAETTMFGKTYIGPPEITVDTNSQDILKSPATYSVFVPLWGPVGLQVGTNLLGPGNGSCLSIGIAAGIGRSFSVGTFGGPLRSGDRSQSRSILGGWVGSASAVLGNSLGYQVAYSGAGAIGGLAVGVPGFSFSYGYAFCH